MEQAKNGIRKVRTRIVVVKLANKDTKNPFYKSSFGPGTVWDELLGMCMPSAVECLADIDRSGAVDKGDLLALLGAYKNVCE